MPFPLYNSVTVTVVEKPPLLEELNWSGKEQVPFPPVPGVPELALQVPQPLGMVNRLGLLRTILWMLLGWPSCAEIVIVEQVTAVPVVVLQLVGVAVTVTLLLKRPAEA